MHCIHWLICQGARRTYRATGSYKVKEKVKFRIIRIKWNMAPYVNTTRLASVSSEKFVETDMSIQFVKNNTISKL